MRTIGIACWIALAVAVVANVSSNLALKRAMQDVPSQLTWQSVLEPMTHAWLWIGLILLAVLLGSYLFAIREVPLSIAYPTVTGLAMAGIVVCAAVFFGEAITPAKLVGIGAIAIGIWLLSH